MLFLHWYDWLTPTNPYASIFFGMIVTVVIAIIVWFETKERKTFAISLCTGALLTLFGVILLTAVGYYG